MDTANPNLNPLGWIVRSVIDSILRVEHSVLLEPGNLQALWIHDFLREAVDGLNDERDREIVIKCCVDCATQAFDSQQSVTSSLCTDPLDLIVTDLSRESDAYSVISLSQLHARIRDEIDTFNHENATQIRVRAVGFGRPGV